MGGEVNDAAIEPRTGSYAALDRRVARLEDQFDKVDTKVDEIQRDIAIMKVEQHAATSAVLAQLAAIHSEQTATRVGMDSRRTEALSWISEPAATPAGRALTSAIIGLKTDISELTEVTTGLQRTTFMAVGAITLLVLVMNLVGPFLMRLVFP